MTAVKASFAASQHRDSTSSKDSAPHTSTVTETRATDSPGARERQWSVLLSCFVAGLLNLTVGVTLSIPSNVILDLTRENSLLGDSSVHQLTTFQQSIFAALASVGAIFSGIVGGWIADRWGRKCSLMFSGIPFVTGYLILSYAHYSANATAFEILLFAGRFMTGVAMGSVSVVVPIYVGEISSTKLRGLYGTMIEVLAMSGITINYALGSVENFYYFYISLVTAGIVALFEVLMFWLPETPRSLLSRGYVKKAEKVLKWLRGPNSDISTEEFKEVKQHIISARSAKKRTWRNLLRRSALVPFSYLVVIFLVKQFCGINAIFAYAGEIFVEAGVPSPRSTAIYAVGVSTVVGVLVAFLTADLLGRKTLLIASGTLMVIGTAMLGTHFYITRPSLCNEYWDLFNDTDIASGLETVTDKVVEAEACNPGFAPLAISSLILYTFGFSVGWGPLPWVLLSELLPLSVRGMASGICLVISYTSSTVVVGVYPEYVELVSPWLAVWTFAVISLFGSAFVWIFIPETKGKSLEAVEKGFEGTPVNMCTM